MLGVLRLLQLLAMVVWVGGLIFFAFVLAPTAFAVLPTTELAGAIVGATLRELHWIGLACGAVFLIVTAALFAQAPIRIRGRYEIEFLLAAMMIVITGFLQWNVLPAMERDRTRAGGDLSAVSPNNPARVHFDTLHKRSERFEGGVLLVGLAVVFLMSREQMEVEGTPTR